MPWPILYTKPFSFRPFVYLQFVLTGDRIYCHFFYYFSLFFAILKQSFKNVHDLPQKVLPSERMQVLSKTVQVQKISRLMLVWCQVRFLSTTVYIYVNCNFTFYSTYNVLYLEACFIKKIYSVGFLLFAESFRKKKDWRRTTSNFSPLFSPIIELLLGRSFLYYVDQISSLFDPPPLPLTGPRGL